MSLTYEEQHDWRDPQHCITCDACRANRARFHRESQADAYRLARLSARDVDAPVNVGRAYHRAIRVPRSNRSVLIQLPHMTHPVSPSNPVIDEYQTRRFRPLFSRKRPFSALQQQHSEPIAGTRTPLPEPPHYTWSAVSSQRTRPNTPLIPVDAPMRFKPLDSEARRNLFRPNPASDPYWKPLLVAPERNSYPMPGAWPSELDDDDVDMSTKKETAMPALGTNIYNAVSFLRNSSYTLFSRIFHSSQQPPYNPPEDDERVSKRRRLVSEEQASATSQVESNSYTRTFTVPSPSSSLDSSPFGDPMDIDTPPLKQDRSEISPPQSPIISSHSPTSQKTARRATQQFFNNKKSWSKYPRTQTVTPPPEDENITTQHEEPAAAALTERVWQPLPPPKYTNIGEFFDHDNEHGLPGFERLRLTPNDTKICELDSQRQERLRIEREKVEKERRELLRIEEEKAAKEREERLRKEREAASKKLAIFGLRRAKTTLISPLNEEWNQRVSQARSNGYTPEIKWQGNAHNDSVQLSPYDFDKLIPAGAWLNDNAIQASLLHLAIYINNAASVVPKKTTPKCVAISSQYWASYRSDKKAKLFPRGLSRLWGLRPDNFLDADTVLIPVNQSSHWTVLVIRPSRRTIAYLDSFYGSPVTHIGDARDWLRQFLGDRYVASEWKNEIYDIPRQSNGYDCGMFVITNSICLALGIDPYCYDEDELPLQRRRIAAMLLNGGFTGPFDLSHL